MDWISDNTLNAHISYGNDVVYLRKVVKGFKGTEDYSEDTECVLADPDTVKSMEGKECE